MKYAVWTCAIALAAIAGFLIGTRNAPKQKGPVTWEYRFVNLGAVIQDDIREAGAMQGRWHSLNGTVVAQAASTHADPEQAVNRIRQRLVDYVNGEIRAGWEIATAPQGWPAQDEGTIWFRKPKQY